jgi:hypothetical protein
MEKTGEEVNQLKDHIASAAKKFARDTPSLLIPSHSHAIKV